AVRRGGGGRGWEWVWIGGARLRGAGVWDPGGGGQTPRKRLSRGGKCPERPAIPKAGRMFLASARGGQRLAVHRRSTPIAGAPSLLGRCTRSFGRRACHRSQFYEDRPRRLRATAGRRGFPC